MSPIRYVAMAGQSVYWSDGEGVHVWSFETGKVRDVVRTPEAGPVAGNEKAVVYSDGDWLILVDLMSGRSRHLADLKNRYQTYEHIVMTHDAVYWGNVHPLGTMKVPERDSLWRVSLEEGARPTLIATIDSLKGFCVGARGEVVWLDGGPGPWMRAPEQDGARVARLMVAGATRPLATVAARADGALAASESGFIFTTLDRNRGDLVVWNVSFDGAVRELPARLPASSSLLGLWQGTIVAMRDDLWEILRVPLSRSAGAPAPRPRL